MFVAGGAQPQTKKWQMELLMERIRSKSTQHKTFQEISRNLRISMLGKQYALDAVEKSNLQKCLDSMQCCIKVTTRQGLVERLESLSRQLGLKFTDDTSVLFISSDMFYLEIKLDANGTVVDVKVHHECKIEQPCTELINCLVKGDFADFTTQLEGLSSIYQLNAEVKIKSKAFVALQALETDLVTLSKQQFSMQYFKDPSSLLLQCDVGIMQARKGGHPTKLTYFVSPYELLDLESKTMSRLTVDLISSKSIGFSVTVLLEGSAAHKLQIQPLITATTDQNGRVSCTSQPLGPINSIMLPANFVLKLNKPMPLAVSIIQKIQQTTDIPFGDLSTAMPILSLITQQNSDGQFTSATKGLFVSLPDQNHCYFLTENANLQGVVVSSVPFTEPSQVPLIIKLLRKQALFNTLISSCIRVSNNKQDIENTTMFEVSALSFQHVSIALEHPFEESMATVEFNMNDNSEIECKIYSINVSYETIALKLSKILEKCMSIPITLRALIKCWEQEKNVQRNLDNGNFNTPSGPNDATGRNEDFRDLKSKNDRSGINGSSIFPSGGSGNTNGGTGGFSEHTMFSDGNTDSILHHEPPYSDSDMSKRQRTEDFWKNPKSETLSSDMLEHQSSDSSDSNSLGTTSAMSEAGVATPSSNASFATESGSDPISIENATSDSQKACLDDDASEMRDLIESDKRKLKKAAKDSRSDGQGDDNKGNLPPSVSITPITSTSGFNSVLTGLERRLGIEIIPISSTPPPNIKSSITITPIGSTKGATGEKPVAKRSDDRAKVDKKKKRKRDDSPMGPPEKMPFKQDPLSRPVSVSIKTTDGAPLSPSGLMRKFSSSPVPGKNSASGGGGSKPSPKHSPAHHSSPKHQDLSSPKNHQYGTSSPKHPASGGSGKPSMSALKSAANSPNSKTDKTSSKSTSNRDSAAREKERSQKSANSPKLIKSSVKLKQIDLTSALLPSSDALLDASSSSQDSNKSSGNPAKIRKGSLSAVIDKLKSAQHIPADELMAQSKSTPSSLSNSFPSGANSISNSKEKTNFVQSNVSSSGNNSEYMVKPSSDGIKLTINKTRTKDSSSPSHSTSSSSSRHSPGSNSGSNSPKTGLKPGVNSGPASKKPQNQSSLAQNNNKIATGTNATVAKPGFQRSSSSGNLNSSKSTSSSLTTKSASGSSSQDSFSKKDKNRPHSKGTGERQNVPMDVMKMFNFGSVTPIDGLSKPFDTKFQIPKLSAQKKDQTHLNSAAPASSSIQLSSLMSSQTQSGYTSSTANSDGTASEMLSDFFSGKDKYPYLANVNQMNLPYPLTNLTKMGIRTSTSPKYLSDMHMNKEMNLFKSSSSDSVSSVPKDFRDKQFSTSNPSTPTNTIAPPFPSPGIHHRSLENSPSHPSSESPKLSNFPINQSMRPPSAPPNVSSSQDVIKPGENALDFSSPSLAKSEQIKLLEQRACMQTLPIHKSNAPSVQLHIVKSPVPSPMVPHSSSPCIDDELMDEASLVGIGSK
ncbi:hypothetical protein HA402_013380 [Bradysia odoriphaga]|nr:hypothetical protein HA402_013380 [Bradysia odoriphaga]